jgi:RimJ/RimL family protein N-acetyltransferase
MLTVHPVTLTGSVVRLEPLAEIHIADLTLAGADASIWRYMPYGNINTEARMRDWVIDLLGRQARGTDLPFAVIHLESGQAIGSTRYMDIQPQHRGLEIGGTWYGAAYQRTAVNTECKYLLLTHAFETLGCLRVQLKTDLRNERSQRAIERIGAVREGVLRHVVIMPDGYRRSSVYYSLLENEWPGVKAKLAAMLRRPE